MPLPTGGDALRLMYFIRSGVPLLREIICAILLETDPQKITEQLDYYRPAVQKLREDMIAICNIRFDIEDVLGSIGITVYVGDETTYTCVERICASTDVSSKLLSWLHHS